MSTQTHLMTADELFALPDDGYRHELIKGELLTMSPSGREHGIVTSRLHNRLGPYIEKQKLGEALCADAGFRLEADPDTVLAPDISFISTERLGPDTEGFHHGAPDLAVEVRSPGDRTREVERKAAMWLALGAQAVWLVDPRAKTLEVRLANGARKIFSEHDEMIDDVVVMGFRFRVGEIFP